MESPVLKEIYQEALVEGRIEGQIEGRQPSLVDILLVRFDPPRGTMRDLENRIRQIEAPAALQHLTIKAMQAETLEDFTQALDRLVAENIPT